jgi:prepilin-type processing-associated H-X9-DG protein
MSASKPDEHSVQTEATDEASARSSKNDVGDETEYLAPLRRYDGVPIKPNHFNVTFFDGHTRKKHWEAIGEDLGAPSSSRWYWSTLSDEQLERVRRDLGVKEGIQSGNAVWG